MNLSGDSSVTVLPAGFTLVEADVKVGGGKGNPDDDAPDGCFDVDLTSDDATPNAGEFDDFILPDPPTRGPATSRNINVVFSGLRPGLP